MKRHDARALARRRKRWFGTPDISETACEKTSTACPRWTCCWPSKPPRGTCRSRARPTSASSRSRRSAGRSARSKTTWGSSCSRARHRALALTAPGPKLLLACQGVLAQLRRTVSSIRAPNAREVLSLYDHAELRVVLADPAACTRSPRPTRVSTCGWTPATRCATCRAEGFDIAVRYQQRQRQRRRTPVQRDDAAGVCAGAAPFKDSPLKVPADLRHHTLLESRSDGRQRCAGGVELVAASQWRADPKPRSKAAPSRHYNEVVAAAGGRAGRGARAAPLLDGLLAAKQLVALFGDARRDREGLLRCSDPAARARPRCAS